MNYNSQQRLGPAQELTFNTVVRPKSKLKASKLNRRGVLPNRSCLVAQAQTCALWVANVCATWEPVWAHPSPRRLLWATANLYINGPEPVKLKKVLQRTNDNFYDWFR